MIELPWHGERCPSRGSATAAGFVQSPGSIMEKPSALLAERPPPGAPSRVPEEVIRIRAYQKWVQRGCPEDDQQQDWLDAEAECLLEQHISEADPSLVSAILNNTTAVIYVKDLQGRYLLINRRYESLFKVRLKWLIGRTDLELFPLEIAEAVIANDRKVLAAGTPIEFEERVNHDDGLHTYISLKFPIRNIRGELYAVCGISTDITERQRLTQRRAAEHAVTRALAEASKLSEAGSQVLQALCDCLSLDLGALWYVDGPVLRCAEVWSAPALNAVEFERMTRSLVLPRGTTLPGRVWAKHAPAWLPNIERDVGLLRRDVAMCAGLHCALAVPIRESETVTGVLEFFGRNAQAPDADLLNMLDAVGRQIGVFIQRKRAEAALRERSMELELARRIQQGFFPRKLPRLPGLEVAAESQPAQETGGDYVDFVPMAAPSLGLALGDVSGHGVGSALLMALTRAYLRAYALSHSEPGEIVPLLNRSLAADIDADHFVTLFFARLDTLSGDILYWNAGHLPGYVIGADGKVRLTLDSTSYPLGLDADGDFPPGPPARLLAGDLLFVLTDGITEAFGPDGHQYGTARALALVCAQRNETPRRILDALFEDVRCYSAGQPELDDRSALLIRWQG
jgi:PAS domain S-box-containing protein